MKIRRLAPVILTMIMVITLLSMVYTPEPVIGERSGDYPRNYEIQDYEPSADEQWDLDVAMDADGRFYSVWVDARDKVPEVRFSKSLNGTSWGDGEQNNNDIVVSDGPNTDERVEHPSIAVDEEGIVYCIWIDDRGGDAHLRFTTSTSSGNTWNGSKRISEISGSVSQPYMRYSSGTGFLSIVYVLEQQSNGSSPQKEIMYTYSDDGGSTFKAPIMINDDASGEDQFLPRMAVSKEGWVAIVWQDYRNGDSALGSNSDVYASISKNGKDFSSNIMVHGDPDLQKQEQPDIAFSDGSDLMITWQETSLDGWRVMYTMGWSGSDEWSEEFMDARIAIESDLNRKDQFMPRVGYVDGSFLLSWTELDLRNFYLIRAGYISRYGERVMGDHIVDDSIDWGMFINDPIYHSEMYRETSLVLGYEDEGHVFWLDYRTDPNPSDDLNQDADPYTAIATAEEEIPLPPASIGLKLKQKDWTKASIQWSPSPDIEFKGYYINYGEGTAPTPDENINDFKITDRMDTKLVLDDLEPDTEYEIRMVVKDNFGQTTASPVLKVRTEPNNPPTFEFLEPDGSGDSADKTYEIRWTVSDREERATYTLHYDEDLEDPSDQVFLYSGDTETDVGEMTYVWNTSGLASGGYTINATIDDGVNDPVIIYSSAIIISHPSIIRDHPTVSFITIEGGKDNAFVDAVFDISFDKSVAPTSINDDSLFVLDGQNSRVPGIISIVTSDKITWRPSSPMDFGTEHRIQILPTVTDLEGNELDGEKIGEPSPFSLLFSTRSESGTPMVRNWNPQGQDVPLWTTIDITFDRPLDGDTVNTETIVLIEESSSADVPIQITYEGGLRIDIELSRPLVSNGSYTLNISGLSSRLGFITDGFEWTFTAGQPDRSIDSDNDGVPDDLDWFRDDPTESRDTDLDGKGDNTDTDDDGDQMPDEWELKWKFDPLDPSDADDDPDGDGKTNLEEFREGTTPTDEGDSEINYSLIVLILVAVAVLIVLSLILFSVMQRRRMEDSRMERGFFKDGLLEE